MKLGYIGIDDRGDFYMIKNFPRVELLKQLGATKVEKMYVNQADGSAKHTGYVIKGRWIIVYEVHSWKKGGD